VEVEKTMIRVGELRDPNTVIESISRKRLTSILNHVNFKENSVVVNLKRLRDGTILSLRATPEPCRGETARLTWSVNLPPDAETAYEFADFLIDKGTRVIVVGGRSTDVGPSGITIFLPEHCQAISRRRTERFGSSSVRATLSRNGSTAVGFLRDFGGGFLKVTVAAREAGFLLKGGEEPPLYISLHRNGTAIYEGEGVVERRLAGGEDIDLVLALAPSSGDGSEESRETGLDPALIAICRHPLSDRIIRLHVARVTYNTLVVNEDPKHAVLFPGLIVPEMRIDFGAGDSAQCVARVTGGRDGTWFMSILDMPIRDQRKLFTFVEKIMGMGSGVSVVIDPEDLVEFFFEAGFVYPEKYAGVARSREQLKAMLSRLYVDTPSISQHFVQYDREGAIEGHICMVRFYERAWVVHHHTAIGGAGAGSAVLEQIFRYIYSYSGLPSTGMDYAMTYYRPENRFPNRVLGGFARSLNTPSLCSVDSFSYRHLHFDKNGGEHFGESKWLLAPSSHDDLLALEEFYESVSGGLTLKAFGIDTRYYGQKTIDLDAEFKKAGMRRRKQVFSLKNDGKLKAVMTVLDSDPGLNMSNLLKCIHLFVVDDKGLPFDLLVGQLNRLSRFYEEQEIPLLLFPLSYMNEQGIAHEKVYDLLVFKASVVKQFIEFTERLTNRAARRKYGDKSQEQEGRTSEQR
jgi:hypothetical protein